MAGTTIAELERLFAERFPGSGKPSVYRAPGRVNLIGEHTDYNLGFVMPIAMDLACYAAVAPSGGSLLRIYSADINESYEVEVAKLADERPRKAWTDYVIGVAQQLLAAGFEVKPADLLIHSTVPVGAGLSSSASLEISCALALSGGAVTDRHELVKIGHRAENQFVGMPCGVMDQFVSVFGKAHRAIKLDCRSLEFEAVPLPETVAIIAVNSMVKHELGASAYRERVRECGEAVSMMQGKHPEVKTLRDADESMLDEVSGVPLKRARHIIGENRRVNDFAAAAAAGDLEEMGRQFVASHRSLQHDYEVSCEELDYLVDTATGLEGVYGSRMTGGGFGGCTVNLVLPALVGEFQAKMTAAYEQRYGRKPLFYDCLPSEGAGPIS